MADLERFRVDCQKNGNWVEIEEFQDQRELNIYALNGFKYREFREKGYSKLRVVEQASGEVVLEKTLTGIGRWLPF